MWLSLHLVRAPWLYSRDFSYEFQRELCYERASAAMARNVARTLLGCRPKPKSTAVARDARRLLNRPEDPKHLFSN
jgi:hypothetical protein